MTGAPPIPIVRCEHCHGRFLPHEGLCPRCGSSDIARGEIPPTAVVLAATELLAPAAGWPTPHRLAIVEGAENVRILAIVRGTVPGPGSVVEVVRVGERYECSEVSGAEPSRRPPDSA